MNFELKKAIDQISKDKGLDRDMLVNTLEDAVRTSVLKRFNDDIDVEVNYNDETGDIDVFQFKVVVEDGDVDNLNTQISLAEAKKHDPNVDLDDEVGFRIQIGDLGRIAAQSAKQVIIQRMRDAEQSLIYDEFKDRRGEIVSGIIQRRDKGGWVVNLGRTEAILPRDEQIPREHYKRGDRVQAIITEVRREGRGPQVVISRAHRDYMAALFKREVPEVDEGLVRVMGVARDPGSRAKVAVYSKEREVDPVGACVGVRGSRIQNIVQEFHGERIDIVIWSPDIATYARNALAPAQVTRIVVDEDENLLEVIVPDDQLTNSIGRKGQNVKLAARLLGWKVDIFTASRYKEANALGRLEQVAKVAEIPLETFVEAGFNSVEELEAQTEAEWGEKLGLTVEKQKELRQAIALMAPKEPGKGKRKKAKKAKVQDQTNLESEAEEPSQGLGYDPEIKQIANLLQVKLDTLLSLGYNRLETLGQASDEELMEKLDISQDSILELRQNLAFLASLIEEEKANSKPGMREVVFPKGFDPNRDSYPRMPAGSHKKEEASESKEDDLSSESQAKEDLENQSETLDGQAPVFSEQEPIDWDKALNKTDEPLEVEAETEETASVSQEEAKAEEPVDWDNLLASEEQAGSQAEEPKVEEPKPQFEQEPIDWDEVLAEQEEKKKRQESEAESLNSFSKQSESKAKLGEEEGSQEASEPVDWDSLLENFDAENKS